MELFIDRLYDKMMDEINSIQLENEEVLIKLDRIIPLIQKKLIHLKEHFLIQNEITEKEEIYFFKHQKTKFNALLIFNIELYNFEIGKPVGFLEEKNIYIRNQIQKINNHKNQHFEFYKYLKSNSTYFDSVFFSRNNFDFRSKMNPYCFESDPNFSTSHDFLFAEIKANELLFEHFEKQLIQSEHVSKNRLIQKSINPALKWTSSKSNLIELIYAIHQTGCFNNGNSDIKQIASMFSEIFDINLGDFYRTYLDLKARNDRTKFIDQLRNNLENKMIDDDN